MTLEEAVSVIDAIFEWARTVRSRYWNFECEECGVSWHPRMGSEPPREATDDCGHAHFREAWGEWDEEANDWHPW